MTFCSCVTSQSSAHYANEVSDSACNLCAMAAEKGMTRSCYGVQKYSPEEIKEQWREFMRVMLISFIL